MVERARQRRADAGLQAVDRGADLIEFFLLLWRRRAALDALGVPVVPEV
jgi:hypothetical protein